jgi:hypothetical protein
MAECLNCGSHFARVVESRSVRLGTGERQNWRTTVCPPSPAGCGQRRRQVVVDGGLAVKRWIARVKALRVGLKP